MCYYIIEGSDKMHSKLEIEYKVSLTLEQFNRLLEHYPNHNVIFQNNTYYDTTPSLKDRGMACRIREIDGQHYFTLKIKQEKGNTEIEFPIESNDLSLPSVQEVLNQYHIKGLEEKGSLFTIRHLVEFEHAELCIDKNEYNDLVDYEVEYELKDSTVDTFNEFMTILNETQIPYIPNKRTKIQRCLETRRT